MNPVPRLLDTLHSDQRINGSHARTTYLLGKRLESEMRRSCDKVFENHFDERQRISRNLSLVHRSQHNVSSMGLAHWLRLRRVVSPHAAGTRVSGVVVGLESRRRVRLRLAVKRGTGLLMSGNHQRIQPHCSRGDVSDDRFAPLRHF